MTNIEKERKKFDRFLIEKDFNLSNEEVVKKAIEFENYITKKSQVI